MLVGQQVLRQLHQRMQHVEPADVDGDLRAERWHAMMARHLVRNERGEVRRKQVQAGVHCRRGQRPLAHLRVVAKHPVHNVSVVHLQLLAQRVPRDFLYRLRRTCRSGLNRVASASPPNPAPPWTPPPCALRAVKRVVAWSRSHLGR